LPVQEGGFEIAQRNSENDTPPNFCGLTWNVVDNKRSQIAIIGLTRNVDESKRIVKVLPGIFMILKDLVALDTFSFQLSALRTGFLELMAEG
jgi:hypothetical protein